MLKKSLVILVLIFFPFISFSVTYTPLVDGFTLNKTVGAEGGGFLGQFINQAFTLFIGLLGIMAVLWIIIGGFQYVSTDAWDTKSDGKKRIQAALGGLAIALLSYTILNTIDPGLTQFNFTVAPISGLRQAGQGITLDGVQEGASNGNGTSNPQGGSNGSSNPSSGPTQYLNGLPIDSTMTIRTINGNQYACGKMSTFGGPQDAFVGPTATGAITGERLQGLNPDDYYVAARWDYSKTSKSFLQNTRFEMINPNGGNPISVRPVDWGPNAATTGRAFDVSPGVERALGVKTDGIICIGIGPTSASV